VKVNSGTVSQLAIYSGTGTAVSGDAALTDNGTTLSYTGNASIGGSLSAGALTGTSANFTGNVTVGGQLIATGPWSVSGPAVGMTIAPLAGTSQAAFDANGILSVSENGGSVVQVAKLNSNISGTAANLSGTPTLPSGTVVPGYVAATITVNGHALSSNVTVAPADLAAGALANGMTATTQAAGDSSTKIATDAFVAASGIGPSNPFVPFPGYDGVNQPAFPAAGNALVVGFIVPYAITTSKFFYRVGTTADNTANTYEVGIYNSSGTLVLHYQAAGTTFAPAASATKNQSWGEGSTTLPPGKYYEAITTSCASACATFTSGAGSTPSFYSNATLSVSGNTLGTTISAPGGGYESLGASPLSIILEP
jgi:hypothetical protein